MRMPRFNEEPFALCGLLAATENHTFSTYDPEISITHTHTLVYTETLTHTWAWLTLEVGGQKEAAGGAFLEESERRRQRAAKC